MYIDRHLEQCFPTMDLEDQSTVLYISVFRKLIYFVHMITLKTLQALFTATTNGTFSDKTFFLNIWICVNSVIEQEATKMCRAECPPGPGLGTLGEIALWALFFQIPNSPSHHYWKIRILSNFFCVNAQKCAPLMSD